MRLLQITQNAAALWSLINQKGHMTLLLITLHWLPVAARITFKSLTLTSRKATGLAPVYLNATIQRYSPSRPPRSFDECLLSLHPLDDKTLFIRGTSVVEST